MIAKVESLALDLGCQRLIRGLWWQVPVPVVFDSGWQRTMSPWGSAPCGARSIRRMN